MKLDNLFNFAQADDPEKIEKREPSRPGFFATLEKNELGKRKSKAKKKAHRPTFPEVASKSAYDPQLSQQIHDSSVKKSHQTKCVCLRNHTL